MLFEKVIEDSQKTGERMTEIEKQVIDIKTQLIVVVEKLDNLDKKIDEKKHSVFETKLADNKWFWISIIVFMLLVGSILGANTDFIKNFTIPGG